MAKPDAHDDSTTEPKLTASSKPRARPLRTGPTAKDLDRLARVSGIAERQRARISRLLREVAEVAVQFEPVDDDLAPVGADTIEKHLWGALTDLTDIRPQKASARK